MFFTSSLLWAIQQKPLSVPLLVRSMRELSLRDTLFWFFSCHHNFLIISDAGFGKRLSRQLLWFYTVVQLSPSANTSLGGLTATRLTTRLFHSVSLRGPTAAKGTNPRVGTYRRDGRLEDAAGGPACLTVNLRGPGSLPHLVTRGVDAQGFDSRGIRSLKTATQP